MFFTVLIDAVEICFVDQVGDGLAGHVGARGERRDRGEIELPRIALVRDEEAALVDDQGRGGVALLQQFLERFVEEENVLLEGWGRVAIVRRTAACSG
ncbi:MAG: hypothetical protein U1F98_02225 [Verrucomicrobiota bacterium]